MLQISGAGTYSTRQDGLPGGITSQAYPLPRYEVVRKWGERFRYSRTLSCAIGVTAEQHTGLWRIGEESTACARLALAGVEAHIAGGPLDLPRAAQARLMSSLADGLGARGVAADSDEGHAALRAASHTIESCKTYLRMGRRPLLKYKLDTRVAFALPFRLRAGLVYGAPLVVDRKYLWLGPLGWVALPEGPPEGLPRPVGEVSYAEYTHWDQTWRVRFVFVDEATPEQKAAAASRRVARVKTKTAAPPVEGAARETLAAAPAVIVPEKKAAVLLPWQQEHFDKVNRDLIASKRKPWTVEEALANERFWR